MLPQRKMKIAVFQLPVCKDVGANVVEAANAIRKVQSANPDLRLAILAERFNAPLGVQHGVKCAERVPEGHTCQALQSLAEALGIYIIGGSIVERDSADKLYSTCTVWSPRGKLIGKHRRLHLATLDIDEEMEGGVRCDDSGVLTSGRQLTIVEVDSYKIGIGIGQDVRFAELARLYRQKGCDMLVYPAAFCTCQGPLHWSLLQRARAVDNQLFVVGCSQARNRRSDPVVHGHSMIVDPWGKVVREAGSGLEVLVETIDFAVVDAVRQQLPLFPHRIYETKLIDP